MVHDPSRGRTPYRSPDAVLAEAQRIAADIRRRAEREANAIRREAAEWASSARHDAERYRQRVLAELEHARAVSEPEPDDRADTGVGVEAAEVLDLRNPDDPRPVRLVVVPADEADEDDEMPGEVDAEELDDVVELAHRPAVGGTYVVGHRPPPPGTSIETKVHDVVRLAVRRTFNRRFP